MPSKFLSAALLVAVISLGGPAADMTARAAEASGDKARPAAAQASKTAAPAKSRTSAGKTAAPAAKAAAKPATQPAAKTGATKKAPSLKDLEGVWQADIEATAKRFKVFPTELKNSLSGATFNISAANSRMQLKWKDGATLNRTLKLVSVKNGVYSLKVDGQHDLSIDASQNGRLILIEQPNSIVLTRVPPKPAPAKPGVKPGTAKAPPAAQSAPAKTAQGKHATATPAETKAAQPAAAQPATSSGAGKK